MILSLVHTKGGVAKTTSAIYLAAAAAQRGEMVTVLDADAQGSASSWADRAAHHGTPLPFSVLPATAEMLRGGQLPAGLVIIDTPPGTAEAIDAAIDAADLVVIPSGCAPADIDRVWPTLDITTHRPTTILLTQVDLRTVLSSGVREVLTEAGAPVLQTIARKRQAITAAFGTAPRKLFDYADVYEELHAAMSDDERKAL